MTEGILIIDLGTTNTKTTIYDREGNVLSRVSGPTPIAFEPAGKMEIDPDQLWSTVVSLCGRCVSEAGHTAVRAVSATSMANSLIPLDEAGHPLYAAIGWDDHRTVPYMKPYFDRFRNGEQISGCGQHPLPQYIPFKIQWFEHAFPSLASRVRKWVNVSEYIYHKLTGSCAFVTDYSIASRTMCFDIAGKRWNTDVLRAFSLDPDYFSDPVEAGTVIGGLDGEILSAGLEKGTPVVMGGHDHMCAFVGADAAGEDVILNSTGTSEAVERILPSGITLEPELTASRWMNLECAALKGRTALVKYVTASGRVYQSTRLPDQVPGAEGGAVLSDAVFIPPERAMVSSVTGTLLGLEPDFTVSEVFRVMRDGLYLECRRCIDQLTGDRTDGKRLRIVGGHTRDLAEMQRKCSVIGTACEICDQADIAPRGSFALGAAALNWYGSLQEAMKELYGKLPVLVMEPEHEDAERFSGIYQEKYLPYFGNQLYEL